MSKKVSLGLVVLPLVPALVSCNQENVQQRPNIIYIMSDDHAQQAISIYGHPIGQVAPTPNIDRIGREGAVFQNNYCCNSLSGPSRAAVLTGKHSHMNGFIRNDGTPFDTTQVNMAKVFRENGYQTAMFGKLHLETEPSGFDHFEIFKGQGDYNNPTFYTKGNNGVQYMGYSPDIVTDRAFEWLEKGRDKNKPFFMMVHHKSVHRNWIPAPRHYNLYDDVEFPLPDTYFDDYQGREAAKIQEMNIYRDMRDLYDLKLFSESLGDSIATGKTHLFRSMTDGDRQGFVQAYKEKNRKFYEAGLKGEDLAKWKFQRYMQDYMACVASLDENVGRILDYLDEKGLAENTIVVYCSDQGFYTGEHGWFDKRFMYEESFTMPLVMRWPGHIKPGTQVEGLTQNIDFAPSFLDMCGIQAPEEMQGESFKEMVESGKTPADWRQSLYYHYYEFAEHNVKPHDGVKQGQYKLIHFYTDDLWELYDLSSDPSEMHNIYGIEGTEEITASLKEELGRLRALYEVPDVI